MRAGVVPLARAAASATRKSTPKQAGKDHSAPSPAAPPPSPSASSNAGAPKPTGMPNKPNAFQMPLSLSPALRDFLGVSRSSRADTMKKVWAYIKEKKLQSTDLKSVIICDEKLKVLFGQDSAKFLEISKLLNAHYIKE